jgi:hypothetical protein
MEASDRMLLVPRQLTVLTTSQCTARCAHCSMNSGPERRDRLDLPTILRTIDELHATDELKVVIFAGGEPTLLRDDLLEAIAHAADYGILTRIVTNAYWAATPARARKRLIALREAGLAELNISADDYHLPYVPFDRVANAWRASKGLGFNAVIIANCHGSRSVITPSYICRALGEDLPLRFDERGRSLPLPNPAGDGTIYGLSNAYIQRLGRGHEYVSAEDLNFPGSQDALLKPCPWAVRSAAISAKGDLVACCGMEAEGNPVLDFGALSGRSLTDLLHHANDSLLVNAIALLGPMFLKRFIDEKHVDVGFKSQYSTVCEVCEDIVTNRQAVDVALANAGELAAYVLAAQDRLKA